MPITRKQYITVAELNEVLFTSFADDTETNKLIIEASELISYHTLTKSDVIFEDVTDFRLDLLKIATSYQVQYFDDNSLIDSDYSDTNNSITLGRYSTSKSVETDASREEWRKIAPKTNRYLLEAGLLFRGLEVARGSRANFID